MIERETIELESVGVGIFENELQNSLELAKNYDILSIRINSFVDEKMLEKLPLLKMIATRSMGVDHIDLDACRKRKIKVVNVPEYGTNTVAEYVMALLLAVAKNIVPAVQSVEEGEFSPEGLTGIDLYGKTMGVIGVGRIGQQVIKLAKSFGMKILGVEKTPDPVLAKKMGYKLTDLETCLKEADVISLNVPSNESTFHLINKNNIKLMKKGSILINTCRGPVVETGAILWALNNKILRGAGLDVTEEENNVENISMVTSTKPTKNELQELLSYHLLRDRDDVVFTPHNAFNTQEAIEKIIKTTIQNINSYIKES